MPAPGAYGANALLVSPYGLVLIGSGQQRQGCGSRLQSPGDRQELLHPFQRHRVERLAFAMRGFNSVIMFFWKFGIGFSSVSYRGSMARNMASLAIHFSSRGWAFGRCIRVRGESVSRGCVYTCAEAGVSTVVTGRPVPEMAGRGAVPGAPSPILPLVQRITPP